MTTFRDTNTSKNSTSSTLPHQRSSSRGHVPDHNHIDATPHHPLSFSATAAAVTPSPPPPPPIKPQVILMDINMPILNGFEATRQIRGFEKQKGLSPPATIIALTGLGSAEAQQEAFSSGVDLFLTKPVRLKELTKILEGIQNVEGHGSGSVIGEREQRY